MLLPLYLWISKDGHSNIKLVGNVIKNSFLSSANAHLDQKISEVKTSVVVYIRQASNTLTLSEGVCGYIPVG